MKKKIFRKEYHIAIQKERGKDPSYLLLAGTKVEIVRNSLHRRAIVVRPLTNDPRY